MTFHHRFAFLRHIDSREAWERHELANDMPGLLRICAGASDPEMRRVRCVRCLLARVDGGRIADSERCGSQSLSLPSSCALRKTANLFIARKRTHSVYHKLIFRPRFSSSRLGLLTWLFAPEHLAQAHTPAYLCPPGSLHAISDLLGSIDASQFAAYAANIAPEDLQEEGAYSGMKCMVIWHGLSLFGPERLARIAPLDLMSSLSYLFPD